MKHAFLYGGAATLLLVWGCGSDVIVGHGAEGGAGGSAGTSALGGTSGSAGYSTGGNSSGASGAQSGGTAGALAGGSAGASVGGAAGTNTTGGAGGTVVVPPLGDQKTSGKLDLLFAIDNSTSMADKQQLLAQNLPDLLKRLANPLCVNAQGVAAAPQPASATDSCPTGTTREFAPMRDMHIGVITSSLGSHGGDVCNSSVNGDDKGQLVPSVRSGVPSYNNTSYLNWDPDAHSSPPGQADINQLVSDLSATLQAVGQVGCGYEAQLESVYRFLIDPDPPLTVIRDMSAVSPTNDQSVPQGTNDVLLAQRASFLRPDSAVAVVMLTDEDDCSIADANFGWFIATTLNGGSVNRMYRPTSACASDPGSPCCMSCADVSTPPASCGFTQTSQDANCQLNAGFQTASEDSISLRCWDQKRRLGFDTLQPLNRYVQGFAAGQVPDRMGNLVDNPLFHQNGVTRAPSLFTFSLIAGVPWQDLATSASLTSSSTLDYLNASQLASRWPAIDGDPTRYTNPTDPFMIPTDLDRTTLSGLSQTNPFTQSALQPATSSNPLASPINGHEQNVVDFDDLQYACIFPLLSPRVCAPGQQACDCSPTSQGDLTAVQQYNSPLCQPAGTATQTYGKGYPALRELYVASQLGPRSVIGSVCARNTSDSTRSDYAYQPSFAAIGRRVAATLAPAP